jgi:hypothetical protein
MADDRRKEYHSSTRLRYDDDNQSPKMRGRASSPLQNGDEAGGLWSPERRIAAMDELIEVTVENASSGLKQQIGAARCPAHRLTFGAALVDALLDRRPHEAGGDAFMGWEALAIVHDLAYVVGDVRRALPEGGGKLS